MEAPSSSCIDPRQVNVKEESVADTNTESQADSTASSSKPSQSPKKKRKSWGQVLPEPTTNLPPRKRAKTTEEKQQRLYERIQRNRQAAHNSRMRKQDEMDRLIAENNSLKQDNQHYQDQIKNLQDQLALYRQNKTSPISLPLTPPADSSFQSNDFAAPPSLTDGSSNLSSPNNFPVNSPPASPSYQEFHLDTKQYLEGSQYFAGQDMNLIFGQDMMAVPPLPPAPQTEESVAFDELLNLDGLANSNLHQENHDSTNGLTGFDVHDIANINLFPFDQQALANVGC